jgi:hypothetical protein
MNTPECAAPNHALVGGERIKEPGKGLTIEDPIKPDGF